MLPTQRIRKTAFWLGLTLPVLALLAAVWVTHETNGQFSAAFASVTRTYKFLDILAVSQTHIAEAETGRRGWLLTGHNDYFQQYDDAKATFHNDIAQLKILAADNPEQQTNLDELDGLVAKRLALDPKKDVPGKTSSTGATAIQLTDEGRDTMSETRVVLFQMREQETELLAGRQKDAEDRFIFDQTASLVLVGVTAIALIAIVTILIRLEKLRQIVTVCAWTGQVKDDGEWIRLDEYLKRRFGLSISHGLSDEAAEKMKRDIGERNRLKGAPAQNPPRAD
ncbi:MAG TPA: CHASE3 domain-containing protein [Verrucomicrobiae bacterium]